MLRAPSFNELCADDRDCASERQLGEGGYSFVYLAEETSSSNGDAGRQQQYAVKKVIRPSCVWILALGLMQQP